MGTGTGTGPALLTPREVAQRLRISPRTVYAWIAQGRLPSARLSERVTRVPADAVDALLAAASAGGAVDSSVAAEAEAAYCMRCGSPVDLSDTRTPTERLRALLAEKREEILRLAAKNHVTNVRVFGSVARGDARPGSDIDLLVDVAEGASVLSPGAFEFELRDLLACGVDVTTVRELKAEIRERAVREAVAL